jgi:hypothetical protein
MRALLVMEGTTSYTSYMDCPSQGKSSRCFVSHDGFASATELCFDWPNSFARQTRRITNSVESKASGLSNSSKVRAKQSPSDQEVLATAFERFDAVYGKFKRA